jgi:hypothetical protein
MTNRSFYANQDEKGCSEHGGVAVELIDHSVSGPMMIEGPLGPELSHHPGRPGGSNPTTQWTDAAMSALKVERPAD